MCGAREEEELRSNAKHRFTQALISRESRIESLVGNSQYGQSNVTS